VLGSGKLPVLIAGRPADPLVPALVASLISLALLPFIPILPGLGSLVAVALAVAVRQRSRRHWLLFAIAPVAGLGMFLALLQVTGALSAAMGLGPW